MPSGTSSENSLNANFRERRHGEVRSDYVRGRLNRRLGRRIMSRILYGTAQTSVYPQYPRLCFGAISSSASRTALRNSFSSVSMNDPFAVSVIHGSATTDLRTVMLSVVEPATPRRRL